MLCKYVNNIDVIKHRISNNVVLFGEFSSLINFCQRYRADMYIRYCVTGDISKMGENINGIPVLSIADGLAKRKDELVIILEQNDHDRYEEVLNSWSFKPVQDYVIWTWSLNYTQLPFIFDFIERNKKVWKAYDRGRKQNKVLVTTVGAHTGMAIINSYYGNVLAKKYDAELIGCLIKSRRRAFLEEEVYRSFNTKDFLDGELTEKQRKIVNDLFNYICPQIKNKYDLQNLDIDGINFGFEIYRAFVRLVSGIFDVQEYNIEFKNLFYDALRIIVYYTDYFQNNKVKAVLLTDGLYYEGLVRLIAWKYNAKVYAVDEGRLVYFYKGNYSGRFGNKVNYKQLFESLPVEEQKAGLSWAKEHLEKRLQGDVSDILYMAGRSAYTKKKDIRVLDNNNKVKIMICPHCINDDPYECGKFLFSDHEEWLSYLGELSNHTDYEWYIKYHPSAGMESIALWDEIRRKYPRIKKLPLDVSPQQLKEEGMQFALTLWGSIGHEYPALGIQVINAGRNYHEDFDFCSNPGTVAEYENILLNLATFHKKIDINEIFKFYYIHYNYLKKEDKDIFFPRRQIYTPEYPCPMNLNIDGIMEGFHDQYVEWMYHWFMEECTDGYHEVLLEKIKNRLMKTFVE